VVQGRAGDGPSYWSKCTGVPQINVAGTFVNAPVWDGKAATPRPWRVVPDGIAAHPDAVYTNAGLIPAGAQAYDVELLPATARRPAWPATIRR